MDHHTQTRPIASSATTRRWCVYGIIAWGLASGLYLLLNGLALGLGNMINTPPTGPRSMPPVIMLRIALLAVPILPLMFWFVIAKRGNSHATHYGAMTVALLGIGMHFAWILLFAKLLAGG
ncbi:MAG: hypothetical protein KDA29_12170 [Phycisphaerales bacterium]|nr:hypothetical protein [Phycisphaerales bacterium]